MANVKKKSEVVMLPTEKAENCLVMYDNKTLILRYINHLYTQDYLKSIYCKSYHLYILSDEEPKEGDWFMNVHSNSNYIDKKAPFASGRFAMNSNAVFGNPKKIIATTDSSLGLNSLQKAILNNGAYESTKPKGLPQPSPQFIQAYIEAYNSGNPIKEVMVEYEVTGKCEDTMVCLRGCHVHDGSCKFLLNRKDILKVDKNNYITITKCKDSWTRDEVELLMRNTWRAACSDTSKSLMSELEDKWIEEKL